MDQVFLAKAVLSFIIGGSWVVFATYFADKLGPKIGGLITGLPSTLLFGLFFLGWTQSPEAAVIATSITPLVGSIGIIFLVIFTATIRLGLTRSLGISIISWAGLTYLALQLSLHNYFSFFILYVLVVFFSFYYMEHIAKVKTVKGQKVLYSHSILLFRGVLSGLVIAASVILGKVSGPIMGGVLALFPAMFTSTLTISYLTHGAEFSKSLAKSASLSSMSILVFSVAARYTYIPLGLYVGTLVSIVASVITAYFIYKFVISRVS